MLDLCAFVLHVRPLDLLVDAACQTDNTMEDLMNMEELQQLW